MFNNKFPKVGALKKKAASDLTSEELAAANEELRAAGVPAFLVSTANHENPEALAAALSASAATEVEEEEEETTDELTLEQQLAAEKARADKAERELAAEKAKPADARTPSNPASTSAEETEDPYLTSADAELDAILKNETI